MDKSRIQLYGNRIKKINIMPQSLDTLMDAFSSLFGNGRYKKRLRGLWVCIVWVVWK